MYLIETYICYIGSKIIGPTIKALGSKNRFRGPKRRFFANILKMVGDRKKL